MIYIETTDRQRDILYSLCDVEKVKDKGIRSSLYKRMNDNGKYFNMFVTNFRETFDFQPYNLDSEGYYTWEYDIVFVPFKSVPKICNLLKIEEGTILKRKF